MIDVRYYVDRHGQRPFQRWFEDLDGYAAARVGRSLSRLANGNTSNVRSVGEGVSELKIDFGPGYRIYFGW
jgi:putative addiction module killer protein